MTSEQQSDAKHHLDVVVDPGETARIMVVFVAKGDSVYASLEGTIQYPTGAHVLAALQMYASVGFWVVPSACGE